MSLALRQQSIDLLEFKLVLALQDADLQLKLTRTLLKRLNNSRQLLDLQSLVVFQRVQLLLQPDYFFFKRLLLRICLGIGSLLSTAFDGTDHLLVLTVGFFKLAL